MIATQQELIETFAALPLEAQQQALNFIAFLHQTYQKPVTDIPNITAEAKAILRLPDQDDPSKWITSIEPIWYLRKL